MQTSNLDFVFLSEPKSKQEAAHVVVKLSFSKDLGGGKTAEAITSACANFREFDAEIRRLQTELDIIRAQARKRFIKAHAAAA